MAFHDRSIEGRGFQTKQPNNQEAPDKNGT